MESLGAKVLVLPPHLVTVFHMFLPQKVLLNRQILLYSLLFEDDYNCQQYNCRHNEKGSNSSH